jgi:hypothetical protein
MKKVFIKKLNEEILNANKEFETRQKIAAIQARYIIDGFTQNIKTIKEIAEIEAKNINPDLRFKPYSNTDVNVRNDNALIT